MRASKIVTLGSGVITPGRLVLRVPRSKNVVRSSSRSSATNCRRSGALHLQTPAAAHPAVSAFRFRGRIIRIVVMKRKLPGPACLDLPRRSYPDA